MHPGLASRIFNAYREILEMFKPELEDLATLQLGISSINNYQ
jgi:hypothetical protein